MGRSSSKECWDFIFSVSINERDFRFLPLLFTGKHFQPYGARRLLHAGDLHLVSAGGSAQGVFAASSFSAVEPGGDDGLYGLHFSFFIHFVQVNPDGSPVQAGGMQQHFAVRNRQGSGCQDRAFLCVFGGDSDHLFRALADLEFRLQVFRIDDCRQDQEGDHRDDDYCFSFFVHLHPLLLMYQGLYHL